MGVVVEWWEAKRMEQQGKAETEVGINSVRGKGTGRRRGRPREKGRMGEDERRRKDETHD